MAIFIYNSLTMYIIDRFDIEVLSKNKKSVGCSLAPWNIVLFTCTRNNFE